MLGRLRRMVTPAQPDNRMWAADTFVELAPGWCSSMSPSADPDCVATAYDSTRIDKTIHPVLSVYSYAREVPEAERSAWLDGIADDFREHLGRTQDTDFVRTLERIRIPAGDSIRVEIVSRPEPAFPHAVIQVQYYVSTDNGPMSLVFGCDPEDFDGCRDAFDQMAQTFLHLERA